MLVKGPSDRHFLDDRWSLPGLPECHRRSMKTSSGAPTIDEGRESSHPLTVRDRHTGPRGAAVAPSRGLLIIVPAYNEEDSIGLVLDEVHHHVPGADVLVVDDGSTDRTADVAQARGALLLRLPYNLGVGGAMRAGYKYGHRSGYSNAVQVDADGQHRPSEIPALLAALEGADVIVGARFAGTGDYPATAPRRVAMRALALAVSRHAGADLTDVTSGFRACNGQAMALFAQHYPAEYLGDTVEALLIACAAGLRVRQVPVHMRVRQAGVASQTPLRASLYLLRAMLAMAVSGMRQREYAALPTRGLAGAAGA